MRKFIQSLSSENDKYRKYIFMKRFLCIRYNLEWICFKFTILSVMSAIKKKLERAGCVVSVEYLPFKWEVLSSKPSTAKKIGESVSLFIQQILCSKRCRASWRNRNGCLWCGAIQDPWDGIMTLILFLKMPVNQVQWLMPIILTTQEA
jgi:hypothetical protein